MERIVREQVHSCNHRQDYNIFTTSVCVCEISWKCNWCCLRFMFLKRCGWKFDKVEIFLSKEWFLTSIFNNLNCVMRCVMIFSKVWIPKVFFVVCSFVCDQLKVLKRKTSIKATRVWGSVYKLNEFCCYNFVVIIFLYTFCCTLSILILYSKCFVGNKKIEWLVPLGEDLLGGATSNHFFALEVELLPGKE